jgi:ABC-type Zn uptake system ZnuABC Zn-binding protein ZnuA
MSSRERISFVGNNQAFWETLHRDSEDLSESNSQAINSLFKRNRTIAIELTRPEKEVIPQAQLVARRIQKARKQIETSMNTLLHQIPNTDKDSLKNITEKIQEKIAGMNTVKVHSVDSYISDWTKIQVLELDAINANHLEKLMAALLQRVNSLWLSQEPITI